MARNLHVTKHVGPIIDKKASNVTSTKRFIIPSNWGEHDMTSQHRGAVTMAIDG